jgi:hypothetical protein
MTEVKRKKAEGRSYGLRGYVLGVMHCQPQHEVQRRELSFKRAIFQSGPAIVSGRLLWLLSWRDKKVIIETIGDAQTALFCISNHNIFQQALFYNTKGNVVINRTFNGKAEINISSLVDGVFLLSGCNRY